jgi:folate-binding protein YgfZ
LLGYQAARPNPQLITMLIPANFLQTVVVTGDDRIPFLQGQLSCNMVNAEGSVQLATMCNPRIIAIFYVICATEAVYLIARVDHIEPAAAHLKHFVFRSNVQINHQHSMSIFLSDTATISEDSTLLPGTIEELGKDALRARLKNPCALEITLTTNPTMNETSDDGKKETVLSAESFWSYQMHASAIPELTLEQTEQYLPEPLNLDLSGGINFEKGCYTGQEVIARMHYLGKAKKRLFQFTSNESAKIKAKMPVYDQQGDAVGEVFSVFAAINSMESGDISSEPRLAALQDDVKEAKVIGLAILTNQPADSKNKDEIRQYWIKPTPDEPNSICITAAFPKY